MKTQSNSKVTLVLGGARSGKSRYAMNLAEARFKKPVYIATAERIDAEMVKRIERHRLERGPKWTCVEESLGIAAVLQDFPHGRDGALLDCVTVWLNNVMYREGKDWVAWRVAELIKALGQVKHEVIIVSNEVGMGIVPEHELGRNFRDLAGWLNQDLAAVAGTVVLVIAGIPMFLKGKKGRL